MNIDLIIAALRLRCPSFAGRVAGAAQFQLLPEKTNLQVPCAYVIPLDDNPEANRSSTGYRQTVSDSFAVIIALSNTADERGQAASGNVHALRRELFKALLGWEMSDDYGGIEYDGGNLLSLDRTRLWYQFEFSADFEIGSDDISDPDTWQTIDLASLPALTEILLDDVANPADISEETPTPDGRTTARQRITLDPP